MKPLTCRSVLLARGTQEVGNEAPTSPGPVSRHLTIPSALTVPTEATVPFLAPRVFPPPRRFFFRTAPRRDYLSDANCDSPRDLHHARARTRPHAHPHALSISPFLSPSERFFTKKRATTLSFADLNPGSLIPKIA